MTASFNRLPCGRLPRRRLLGLLTGLPLVSLLKPHPAWAVEPAQAIAQGAVPEKLRPLIRDATGGVPPRLGRVRLSLPALAESGNSVRLKVEVESPMTAAAYVRQIHIFSEKNPRPLIAPFLSRPACRTGRGEHADSAGRHPAGVGPGGDERRVGVGWIRPRWRSLRRRVSRAAERAMATARIHVPQRLDSRPDF